MTDQQELKQEIIKLEEMISRRFYKIEHNLEKLINIIEKIVKNGSGDK